ncbi:MAG: hydantoinase/oxoprolinase family protein [Xanthobacteraceae bacterium]
MTTRFLIAADTGGTFTDLAVHDSVTRMTTFGKCLTDYDDLIAGVLLGLEDTGADVSNAGLMKHGTTHVINALIQRKGSRTALIATRGFRDVLEIGRGNRSVPFDLSFRKPPPLIPRDLRFEVAERIDGQGNVVTPLDEEALRVLVRQLTTLKVDSIAIAFLNAYRNPVHEQAARRIVAELAPQVFVTTSSELSREWGEYERTSTAAANAYVGAKMATYVDRFDTQLRQRGFPGILYMMGSSGGVMSTKQAMALPIAMVESGPVGGCISACEYARALGIDRMIAFDMGGTTAKCALIEDGSFEIESTYYVGGYERGFPLRTPVLDIVEVGAGGGSIAWIDENRRLRVGPQSAGSTPGPIAFGRGGVEPTVTDANVVLGRIGSNSFLNGRLKLDVDQARSAIEVQLANKLGFPEPGGVDRVAQGILDLASVTMAGAIKEISTERGRNVRAYDLFVFGGGGPLFGGDLARDLRIPRVIVPPNPGAFSSFGMLMAEARRDAARTFIRPVTPADMADAMREIRNVEDDLRKDMASDFDASALRFRHEAEMRYKGQAHTVRIRLPEPLTAEDVLRAFEATYLKRYGHLNSSFPAEFIILHVVAFAPTLRPALSADLSKATTDRAPSGEREVFFRARGERIRTPVYQRDALPIGMTVVGPAVIEEYSATTIVGIGDRCIVGEFGELRIEVAQPVRTHVSHREAADE